MLKFTSTTDPRLARLPPNHRNVLEHAITTLCSLYPPEPEPDSQGFVAFIEQQDEPEILLSAIGRDLEQSIECAFRDGSCLAGVTLWGNSGAGITIICPEEEGYAPEIARILRDHLF